MKNHPLRNAILCLLLCCASTGVLRAAGENLCPNPRLEEGPADADGPPGWRREGGPAQTWADDNAHTGKRSLKISAKGGYTSSWVSDIIPVSEPDTQFVFSVWAKLSDVQGGNGAAIVLYHMDAEGKRIGQSGHLCIGGSDAEPATTEWQQHVAFSQLTPEVKGVCLNVRLYGASGTAWFDDMTVERYGSEPLSGARPLRQGMPLRGKRIAVVGAQNDDGLAEQIAAALRKKGADAAKVGHENIEIGQTPCDTIVLGNLPTSRAYESLYLNFYAYEDLAYPGKGGFVVRPLCDPFGTGVNVLTVGWSDDAGRDLAGRHLLDLIETAGDTLNVPLFVRAGNGCADPDAPAWTPYGRRELELAVRWLKNGDAAAAEEYREEVLRDWFAPDEELFGRDTTLHLFYISKTLSWELMESCGVFSDEERLAVANQLLKMMRSGEGTGHIASQQSLRSRENHGTRAARAFYFGWRHFNKYYRGELGRELDVWRNQLRNFWRSPLSSSRSYEDSLSQHALGGSLDNALDIAFMEPEWSREFFESGLAKRMGERCIAICNNMGRTVLLGDTAAGDYPTSVFAKLAYALRDGRYLHMIGMRGNLGTSSDEPFRGFYAGIPPRVPEDHVGLTVVGADDLYWRSALKRTEGVTVDQGFDKLTFRSGFAPDDEYLLLDGVAGGSHSYDDANTIGEYAANARRWLCEIDIFNGPTMSFHNAVTVARQGLGEPTVPEAARLVDSTEKDDLVYTATELPNYNGVNWTRHMLWKKGQFVYVVDELTANVEDDFSFVLGWRSLGTPTLAPGRFVSAQDGTASGGLVFSGAQLTADAGASSGKHYRCLAGYDALLYRSDTEGDYIETTLSVPADTSGSLVLTTLDFTDRGIMSVSLDGREIASDIDLLSTDGVKRTDHDLGPITLTKGTHTVRFSVTGRNPASAKSTIAIAGIAVREPGIQRTASHPNRFAILFPPDVPAILQRDTETLGKYLPSSPYHDQALNVLEQSMNRHLKAGESACFQNLFFAWKGNEKPPFEFRRLDEHCALISDGTVVSLLGASAAPLDVELGAMRLNGRMLMVSPKRQHLRGGGSLRPTASGRVADMLSQAWERSADGKTEAAESPWGQLPALRVLKSVALPARPLSLAALRSDTGAATAVGLADGTVHLIAPDGTRRQILATDGPVHALCAADLNANGRDELLVGSDDEHLIALADDGTEIWRTKIPFLRKEQPWLWWTLNSAKVRKIHAGDITGDGTPEILVGAGNMRLQCLDSAGNTLWRFRTDHGICTTITTADVFGEGRPRVLAGNGLTSSNGACWVLDENGSKLQTYYNGSWCTSLPAIAVADLDGDGTPTVFCGNNRGNVRAYPAARGRVKQLWIHNMTRPVRSLTPIPAGEHSVIVVGSDSGTLCAFDQAGRKAWGTPLSSAILDTVTISPQHDDPAARGIAAACRDGRVFALAANGQLRAWHDDRAPCTALTVADITDAREPEIIVTTASPNRLLILAVPPADGPPQ